jgi:hypothetical protein
MKKTDREIGTTRTKYDFFDLQLYYVYFTKETKKDETSDKRGK